MADTDSDREADSLLERQELADLRAKAAMFDTFAKVVELAPATFLDQLKSNQLERSDADKVFRLIQVFSAAVELFEGNTIAAHRWLTQPVKGLDGELPINMIDTKTQTDTVIDLIGRLELGVVV